MQTATPVPALVPRETHTLAYLAKWSLRVVLLLGAMVALASQATAAPVVFDVSAQSGEGWAVSGTVTIDTATGKVLFADLTAEDGISRVIFDTVYYGTVTQITARRGYPVWTRMFFEDESGHYSLFLTVPEATLVGFKGSSLAQAIETGGGYTSCIEYGGDILNVVGVPSEIPLTGSLEPQ
jgi:hypothetical protein